MRSFAASHRQTDFLSLVTDPKSREEHTTEASDRRQQKRNDVRTVPTFSTKILHTSSRGRSRQGGESSGVKSGYRVILRGQRSKRKSWLVLDHSMNLHWESPQVAFWRTAAAGIKTSTGGSATAFEESGPSGRMR